MTSEYYHLDSSKSHFKNLLSKFNKKSETVQLSGTILKINKRNKKQQRIFVLTNKAIYNLKPKSNAIKRRIDLLSISSIITSSISTEFTINVPSEYDYRFDAVDISFQRKIISEISQQIANLQHGIFINQINDKSTIKWTITKNILQTVNSHYDESVRIAMALDYLIAMGFKSKMSQIALKQNKVNLPLAMQSLINEFVRELEENKIGMVKSPFVSKEKTPLITKVNCNYVIPNNLTPTSMIINHASLTPSSTEQVNDHFAASIAE